MKISTPALLFWLKIAFLGCHHINLTVNTLKREERKNYINEFPPFSSDSLFAFMIFIVQNISPMIINRPGVINMQDIINCKTNIAHLNINIPIIW